MLRAGRLRQLIPTPERPRAGLALLALGTSAAGFAAVPAAMAPSLPGAAAVVATSLAATFSGAAIAHLAARRSAGRELSALGAALDEHTRFDAVTGLPSAQAFLSVLETALACPGGEGAVLHVRIANTGAIFAQPGAHAADALLAATAERLVIASPVGRLADNRARASSPVAHAVPLVARIGLRDFALHVPGITDEADLLRLAGYLHVAFHRPLAVGDRQVAIEFAIGIAPYRAGEETAARLIEAAGIAAAAAHATADADSSAVFREAMRDEVDTRRRLETELRNAIVAGEIEVHYQPKIHMQDWSLAGAEALVRWRHPERGLLAPADFLDVAEKSGLIVDLGFAVMDMAIGQCAHWLRSGRMIEMAVNVSPAQLRYPEFSRRVINLVGRHGCLPSLVTLEIVGLPGTQPKRVLRQIAALRQAGIRIAIDDFGAGIAELAGPGGAGFDAIKISRSLVAALETDDRSVDVARAAVALGRALDCRVVASGAETPGEIAAASTLGCDEVQGFYVAHPLTLEAFETWQIRRGENDLSRIVKSIFGPDFGEEVPHDPAYEAIADKRRAG